MRWSTFRNANGEERVGAWHGDVLYAAPGVRRLVDLLGDDGTRLREAGEAAIAAGDAVDPAAVELLAPVPDPPSIRDFVTPPTLSAWASCVGG